LPLSDLLPRLTSSAEYEASNMVKHIPTTEKLLAALSEKVPHIGSALAMCSAGVKRRVHAQSALGAAMRSVHIFLSYFCISCILIGK
jgi:hypothetical protein